MPSLASFMRSRTAATASALALASAFVLVDADGSPEGLKRMSLADIRAAANIYHIDDYGGWSQKAIAPCKQAQVLWVGSARTNVAANNNIGSPAYSRIRVYTPAATASNAFWLPFGTAVWLSGFQETMKAGATANNRLFWIDNSGAETVNGTSYRWFDLHGPQSIIDTIGSDTSPLAGVAMTGTDTRVEMANFEFKADGTPNPGVPFSNHVALNAILDAIAVAGDPAGRKFSAIIDFGPGVYPMAQGVDLKGRGNIVFRGPGEDQGGVYFLPQALSNGHGFFIEQDLSGDHNTQTIHFNGLFVVADKNQTFVYGDRFTTGTGDLLKFHQKIGTDGSPRSTQFNNFVGGVDPQFVITHCRFVGGRNGISLRGRGDCQIFFNKIGEQAINGYVAMLFDSKTGFNIITATGENAIRYVRGTNNIQSIQDHTYFTGYNTAGQLTYAGNSRDEILQRLSAFYTYGANVKLSGTRFEDTAGPAWTIAGNAENIEAAIDLNSIGSIGPNTVGGFNTNLATLPVSGTSWYGENGFPAIYVPASCTKWGGNRFDILIRTGRTEGGRISHVLQLVAAATGSYRNTQIDIRQGVNQNASPTDPLFSEAWTNKTHHAWIDFIGIDTTAATPALREWIVRADGRVILDTGKVRALPDADYTLVSTDNGRRLVLPAGAARTVTVPASLPDGFEADIINTGAGTIALSGAVGNTGAIAQHGLRRIVKAASVMIAA